MSHTKSLFLVKICCMGAEKKTDLIRKIVSGKFTTNYLPTLGVDITTKRINTGGIISNLIVVDTAGQAFFGKLRSSYYQGTFAGIIFIDKDEPQTLKRVESYIEEFKEKTTSSIDLRIAKLKFNNEKREDKTLNKLAEELKLPIVIIESPRQLEQLFDDIILNLLT